MTLSSGMLRAKYFYTTHSQYHQPIKIEGDSKDHVKRAVFAETFDVSLGENSTSMDEEGSSVNINSLHLVKNVKV